MKIEIKLILEYDSTRMTEEEKRNLYKKHNEYLSERGTDCMPPLDERYYDEFFVDKQIDFPDKWSYNVYADENAMFKPE